MKRVGLARRPGNPTAQDWNDAAHSAMVENGVGQVDVESLARWLGVLTKGIFYWLFADRRA